jgi:hypothetical protein
MRKATFSKTDKGYKPVNKRAKQLTKGKLAAKSALKRYANKHVSCYVWTNAGLRKVA